MNQEIINEVLCQMIPHLSNDQIVLLKNVLEGAMLKSGTGTDQSDEVLVDSFIAAKRLEGCSERTLVFYKNTIDKMLASIGKNIKAVTTEDLRGYLSEYQNSNMVSKVTIDNIRRNLSSFFSWLEDENYILKSPVRRIHRVKATTSVKETYTDEDLERLRDSCTELRDLALIDILASTGMRVGELVRLNRVDINFNERECVVFGKGDKERIVYFDARTKIHLQNYLDDRIDNNPALFVGLKHPYNWNEVYQLSHELLHAAFYKYNGCMPCEYLWIEEIVCEAFSIYCIEKYCHSEKIYWFGYLSQNYYILNGNVSEPEKIKTIKELNGKLGGFKEYGVRQFIHPYALDIKNIINEDFGQLEEFLNYRKYIQDGKIEIDATNRIAIKIFSLQEKLQ